MIKTIFSRVKEVFSSLRVKFIAIFILAVGIGVCVYFFSHSLAHTYIENVYTSTENRKERELSYIKDLQSFVNGNEISSENTSKLSEWAKRNRYVYLLIYRDNELFYTSDDKPEQPEITPPDDETVEKPEEDDPSSSEDQDSSDTEGDGGEEKEDSENADEEPKEPGGVTVDYPTREELFEYAKKNDLHPLELADGTMFASIAEFTEYLYYDIANISCLVLAFFSALVICAFYFYLVINRVIRLGNEVNKVADGDVNHTVRFDGADEISKLSVSVDIMRNSMIENFKKEREALDSNTALITSMSHDIRTPLTILLGYIDVMSMKFENDAEMQSYLKATESTAMRLKKLSDDMFNYFLVFGGKELEIEMENYDALTLIDQMLSEHIILMKESRYIVEVKDEDFAKLKGFEVRTDAQKLVRIFDNIFSNIYKYADKSAPVSISIECGANTILISFSNVILQKNLKTESNGIGLKTCKKLGEYISAEFETVDDGKKFTTALTLKSRKIN